MRKLALQTVLIVLSIFFNTAKAGLTFSYSPTPLISSTETTLIIQSRWPELIQIFPGDPAFAANVVVNGRVVNLDVTGGYSLAFFSNTFTHVIPLGQLDSDDYQLKLRYRDLPRFPGVPGTLNPGVIASSNFTVGRGVELVTQVPTFSTNAAIGLSLMLLGLGVFAVRRQA